MNTKTQSSPDGASAEPFKPEHLGAANWGQGGRFVMVDGQRVPAPPESDTAAPAAAPADQPAKKGK